MKTDRTFLSDEENKNAEDNAQRLAEIIDIFYSIVRLAALTPKALKESDDRLAIGIFGMFLKTILADLRSVHILISVGYPFSAATVASSLWEKSVMGRFILKSPTNRIQAYLEHPTKKRLPWNMKTILQELVVENDPTTKAKAVDLYYVQYTYLCSLKHPQAETISKASDFHFDESRTMELIPGKPHDSRGVNFLSCRISLLCPRVYEFRLSDFLRKRFGKWLPSSFREAWAALLWGKPRFANSFRTSTAVQ